MKNLNREYSLILKKGQKVFFSSRESGLKPLVECIARFAGKLEDAFLMDKVVGTGAARLIVFSKMISRVRADLISEEALRYLSAHQIQAGGQHRVTKILGADKKSPCPMEKLSGQHPDDEKFFSALLKKFAIVPPN